MGLGSMTFILKGMQLNHLIKHGHNDEKIQKTIEISRITRYDIARIKCATHTHKKKKHTYISFYC